jgi:hypothetical protein
MRRATLGLSLAVLVGLLVAPLAALPAAEPAAAATGFAAPAFESVWTRTDLLVENQTVKRSWIWGPQPLNTLNEPYAQSPGGQRQVQYFDKSRMEINNPATNAVTNGLLATELISGRLQVGDDNFEQKEPAQVNVAGDSDDTDGPTYASLNGLLGEPALAVGSPVIQTIDRNGGVGEDAGKASYGVTAAYLVPETNQSVASAFWDFLNQTGPVVVGGQQRTEKLFEPTFFATGLPITRAYWARVKVAGTVKDVLLQAFERRVLTYTPDNPEGFKVEMGNVGRHYYAWRYGSEPTPSTGGGGTPQPSDFQPLTGPHIGYGFNGYYTFQPIADQDQLANLQRSLNLADDADFDWIRQQIVWATLEPSPGQYSVDQLAVLDAIVREAAARNMRVVFTLTKSPRWAVAGDGNCHTAGIVQECGLPQDPQAAARVLTFLAQRYRSPESGKYAGIVAGWEVWNEQNTGGETGNNVQVGPYIELLKASYAAIKAVDPRYIVLYGGLTPTGVNNPVLAVSDVTYLEQSYQYNGGEVKRYFDVLAVHPGSNNNPPDAMWPENPGPGTGCPAAPNCWRDDGSFYFRRVEQLRAVMERYGDAQYGATLKQIWLTEFGWTTTNLAPGYGYGSVISEEQQAQYIVRAFEKGQRDYPWMGVMFLWTLNHSVVVPCNDEKYPWSMVYGHPTDDPNCAAVQPAGKQPWEPRPAFIAIQNMPKP